jgi:hypothetical protein
VSELASFLDSAWPLLVVEMPRVVNVAAIRSVIDGYERLLARNERFAHVVDGSAIAKFPGTVERKMLADWLTDAARIEKEHRLTVGTGIVVTSGPMRALMSALNWIRRPTTPQTLTATRSEAIDWCCARLAEAGIALTPAIGALRARAAASVVPMRRAR